MQELKSNYAVELLEKFIGDEAKQFHPQPFPTETSYGELYGASSKLIGGASVYFDELGMAYLSPRYSRNGGYEPIRPIKEEVRMLHSMNYRW